MNVNWISALMGGAIIGVSVSLMLLWSGRVTGISGILSGALAPAKGDTAWRWYFLAGLILGGFVVNLLSPTAFAGQLETQTWTVVVAGLLVGFGTVLGSGCTSGHGVCGISRLSPRSLAATMVFIVSGMIAVIMFRKLGINL